MFLNYLRVAFRQFLRHKGHTLINIAGLGIGMACCLLILLYVDYELSYDRFHENAGRIYRLIMEQRTPEQTTLSATALTPIGPLLQNEFPEIEQVVQLKPPALAWMLQYRDRVFYERGFYLADPDVFKVFTIPLTKGDPNTVLSKPNAVVVSESMARKYFGNEDPIGKSVRLEGGSDAEITGVMRDWPTNSHLRFDFLASFALTGTYYKDYETRWDLWSAVHTYLLLPPDYNPDDLERKLAAFVEKHVAPAFRAQNIRFTLRLQPLTSIHLQSHLESEMTANGDEVALAILTAIALVVLLIACINFVNLTTAQTIHRAKEIGVRKLIGANRWQLIQQMIGEAVMLASFALILALVLVELSLPSIIAFSGKPLTMPYGQGSLWLVLGGMTVVVGLLAGSYPAAFLTAYEPITMLKGLWIGAGHRAWLRSGLVVTQFALSILLLIATGIIERQLHYVHTTSLGYHKDGMVVLPISTGINASDYKAYKQVLLNHPRVQGVTVLDMPPGRPPLPVIVQKIETGTGAPVNMLSTWVDEDYNRVFGLTLAAGRFFSMAFVNDVSQGCVLNETAVRRLGWVSADAACGQQIAWRFPVGDNSEPQTERRTVVGVVKDYHTNSLHVPIEPLIILPADMGWYMVIKLMGNDLASTLSYIRDRWHALKPDVAFDSYFLDQDVARYYHTEEQLGALVGGFALLAVLIACLGLLGLVSFTAARRTKEIGIRKVLGASVPGIILLLSKEFTLLVAAANLVAWPVAYLVMRRWLQNFTYRIDMDGSIFVAAGLAAFLIAFLTVSYHALRAARTNPVEALRYE
jgi:putative ABC transport system permease protein